MLSRRGGGVSTTDLWSYRETAWGGTTATAAVQNTDLTGFSVEALDGGIGKIHEATYDVGGSYIVVDTGPWILGKKVMLPAGLVDTVDLDTETVYVNRTKDEIKNAPEFDEAAYGDEAYRSELAGYYDAGPSASTAPGSRREDEPLI
jgi:hypothetical protein